MLSNNPNFANFTVILPENMIHPDIIQKFDDEFTNTRNLIHSSVKGFIDSSVTGIGFPSITEVKKRQRSRRGTAPKDISSSELSDITELEVDVTFRMLTGCFNYWLQRKSITKNHTSGNKEDKNLGTMIVEYKDDGGLFTSQYILNNCTIVDFSGIELSYAEDGIRYRTYTVTFQYTSDVEFDILVK